MSWQCAATESDLLSGRQCVGTNSHTDFLIMPGGLNAELLKDVLRMLAGENLAAPRRPHPRRVFGALVELGLAGPAL
jgi:hypothetical protein